jgi:sugar lactone lactonase YvrE
MKPIRVVAKMVATVCVLTFAAWSLTAAEAAASGQSARFPSRIELPNGFRPEGIAIKGKSFFVGSLGTGAIYRGDLRTGTGTVINNGEATGAASVGLAVDQNGRVFAAGGATGKARVVDGRTGELITVIQLTSGATFVNDVVIAQGSAWFTDSVNPVLYRVPLDLVGQVQTVPLTGAIVYGAGNNVNGIDATADGKTLVLVQTNAGKLFTTDQTGVTKEIVVTSDTVPSVPNGDGILLEGRTLYVVQNRLNVIAVIKLDKGLASGTVSERLSDPGFDVPTTIDRFGNHLYAVNARFTTPPTPDTSYWLTAVRADHGRRGHHEKD